MREQVVDLVEQLEAWPCGDARHVRTDRQRRGDGPERLDRRIHQPDRDVGQDLQLFRGLVGVGEVPGEKLEQDLVGDVEQIHAADRPGIGDERHGDAGRLLADVGRHDRPGGLEGRVRPLELEVLVEDPEQAPEMRVAPFATCALALLDDRVDGSLRRLEIGDRDEFRPAKVLFGGLGVGRPDEQALGAKAVGQVLETGLDRPVQLADRVELLELRDDLVPRVMRQRDGFRDGRESFGVLDVHPLGTLEEGEMPEGGLVEGQELDPDAGRIAVRRHREVRAGQARRGPDRRQEVLRQRHVEHLLRGDLEESPAPAPDRGERVSRQALVDVLLERERREQVLEHDQVLELGRLAERIDQRLAVLEPAPLGVTLAAADGEDIGKRSMRAWRDVLDHRSSILCRRITVRRPRRLQPRPCRGGRPDSTIASPRRVRRIGSWDGPSPRSGPWRGGSG